MYRFTRLRGPVVTAYIAAGAMLGVAACSDQAALPTAPDAASTRVARAEAAEGAVYVSTNNASANAVLAFHRAADGSLSPLGSFPTGGAGIGGTVDPLASQGSVRLSEDRRFLFVVNAGSNDVTSFSIGADGRLTLADRASSGGREPVSLTERDGLLYVLNTGDNTVAGLRVNPNGKLTPIVGATRALGDGAAGAATIGFGADGRTLIVAERVANRIETLAVAANGRLGSPTATASTGVVPFAFDVTANGTIVLTEAGGTAQSAPNSSVSSYRTAAAGGVTAIASISSGGAAACWVVATEDGRYAFVANSASHAIASVRVGGDGALTLLDGAAGAAAAGSAPIDIGLSSGDHYLYALEAGAGAIGVFGVGSNGTLTAGTAVPTGLGGGTGLQGIAAY
jgi:6-phosphogluconolactonase (cycloisomerase 2 family)